MTGNFDGMSSAFQGRCKAFLSLNSVFLSFYRSLKFDSQDDVARIPRAGQSNVVQHAGNPLDQNHRRPLSTPRCSNLF
jgi:hypothetical protein